MKKTIYSLLLLILIMMACKKEINYQKHCGIITEKYFKPGIAPQPAITVDSNGTLYQVEIGLLTYNNLQIGNNYCW